MISERIATVRERIARAAARAGRDPGGVTLVAISKTHPPAAVREAYAAGVRDFGENKVQEAEEKVRALADLGGKVRWHLVGHLQGNKARKAVPLVDLIHTVDGVDLARRLERVGAENKRVVRVLVQLNLAGEETKSGLDETHLFPTLEVVRGLKSVRAEGLMVLPPYTSDPDQVRPIFRRLRELRDQALAADLLLGSELSMGMSHDVEVAVEEGATLVRVGTAIFGERT